MSRGRHPWLFGETPQSAAEGGKFIVGMMAPRVISQFGTVPILRSTV